MKRPLKPEELVVWGLVAATVHPLPGRSAAKPSVEAQKTETAARVPPVKAPPGKMRPKTKAAAPVVAPRPVARPRPEARDPIEPRRKHRIARERDPIGARLDLHGLDQDRARAVLEGFLARAWDEGFRAVLVITGKGVQGDGILRKRAPEWLGAAKLAHIVAGVSPAARHHGGDGALYVALKRKGRG